MHTGLHASCELDPEIAQTKCTNPIQEALRANLTQSRQARNSIACTLSGIILE